MPKERSDYRQIALPLPFALRSVNAYLVEGPDGFAIVDCGLHTEEGERALRKGLTDAGVPLRAIRDVFVTHLHPDHLGMAGWLESHGARVHMHGPEVVAARETWWPGDGRIEATRAWFRKHGMPETVVEGMAEAWRETGRGVDPLARTHEVADGEDVLLAGRRYRLLWTPGHTDFHAVLYDADERVLLAGDHVLPRITSNVGWYPWSREDPLADFLRSLARVRPLDVRRVLPAHGDPFDDLAGRVEALLAHHQARLQAIREILDGAPRDAYGVARKLFPVLRSAHEERFALAEVLAHLRYLERRGEVRELRDHPVRWQLVRD